MRLSDAVVDRVLSDWPVARLATVGSDGRPHVVPIVFARLGGRLWSAIDGKPKAGGEPARVRNVRANPRVSLLLDEYGPDWRALWWVRVDATARVVQGWTGDADAAAAVAALQAKYPQYARVPVVREPPTFLAFDVEGVRTWCAAPDAGPFR